MAARLARASSAELDREAHGRGLTIASPELMIVVITGASAGVGRATARAFARAGADVALIARGVEGLEACAREVEALGQRSLVLPLDVTDDVALDRAAERVESELGPIDVWVNNAMVSVYGPVLEVTPPELRRVTEVTYLGYVWGTQAALRRMKPRDRGTIVQVGSALAYRGIPLQSAYCAAKHAIKGFTESLLCELHHDHSRVRVTMVELPAVNTPQFDWSRSHMPRKFEPIAPVFEPEVATDEIVRAAFHPRRDVWVGWPTVKAILGERIAPGVIDRYLGRVGYRGQQSDEARPAGVRDNLFRPLPGDHGAHGRFGAVAKPRSMQVWASRNRAGIAATFGLALVAAIGLRLARA